MGIIAWKEEYSVNIKEIDNQHQQLLNMVNELHEAMSHGQGKEALGKILDKLIDYTAKHFALEERLMKMHGYPEFLAHKEKHDKMTAKVLALQADYKAGKLMLSIEVSKFLQDWLNTHILGTDKSYSGYLNAKGVH